MKKFISLLLVALTLIFTVTLLSACNREKDKIDLTPYLGSDEELLAKTPASEEYFDFVYLPESDSYAIALKAEAAGSAKDYRTSAVVEYCEPAEEGGYPTRELVIPGKYNGKTVTKILKSSFDDIYTAGYAFHIYIQPGITEIEAETFLYNNCIQAVQFPSTLKRIGENAFFLGDNYHGMDWVKFGSGIEYIASGNDDLFVVHNYHDGEFYCSITLPDSLKYWDCDFSSLAGNYTGKDTDDYGRDLTYLHTYRDQVYIGNPNNPYMVLVGNKNESLVASKDRQELVIHPTTKIISARAFADDEMKAAEDTVVIPEGVTQVGDRAFLNVNLGYTLDAKAVKYTLPTSLAYIGDEAFAGTNINGTVALYDSLMEIGKDAFGGCILETTEYGLCEYIGNEGNPYVCLYKAIDLDEDSDEPFDPSVHGKGYIIHEAAGLIAPYAFDGCGLVVDNDFGGLEGLEVQECYTLYVPDNIVFIGENAFNGMGTLHALSLPYLGSTKDTPKKLDYFGSNAMQELYIREGATEIVEEAFANSEKCAELEVIHLPSTVKLLYSNTFNDRKGDFSAVVWATTDGVIKNAEGDDSVLFQGAKNFKAFCVIGGDDWDTPAMSYGNCYTYIEAIDYDSSIGGWTYLVVPDGYNYSYFAPSIKVWNGAEVEFYPDDFADRFD